MSFQQFLNKLNLTRDEELWYIASLGTKGYTEMLVAMWINFKGVK